MASLFSQSWYRVSGLKPRLRGHAEIHRQRFRGAVWYVLQDHQTGRFHRLSPSANLFLCLMDGQRSVQEIWEIVCARAQDDPPTQDETIRLLSLLHGSDLLQGAFPPDFAELSERAASHARRTMMARIRNPLALRLPLFDPDRVLDALRPLYQPLFSGFGLICWLALVATGITIAALHWRELVGDATNQMLTAQSLALMAVTYVVVKGLHELGHACAAKAWGGEVHEVGVMLLVLIPAPYVEASAAAAFPSKWQRMVVSAAGIIVELALAGLASIVWVLAEPGLAKAVAFNVMVIGGVSTLLFNGNPLLRFDGYYILADLIEIPNLAARANRYVFYWIQKHLFHIHEAESPVTARGERRWLAGYAVASFLYRMMVSLAIAAVIATQFFIFGVVLAIVAVAGILVVPVFKGIRFLLMDPKLRGRRRRALWISAAAAGAVLAGLFVVPLPHATIAQGVVWAPDQSELRARVDGVLARIDARPGQAVAEGEPLLTLDDPVLTARVAVLAAQLEELRQRYDAVRLTDRVQAEILNEQIASTGQTLASFRSRSADLTLSAGQAGRFVLPEATDLVGRYVHRGDRLGYVLKAEDPVIRVVVPQADIDLVRSRPGPVAVRLADRLEEIRPGLILREIPGAQSEVPSPALTTQGGGPIAIDMSNPQKPRALQSLFVFDIRLAGGIPLDVIGERAYIRFDHGREAVGWRALRGLRQIFLSQFRV
ncbi:HlyD family efflux transporter periplasmic adaptor subunit [Bosea sp. (in: a-proteobacteria)]|uniref:HlyD family efflux transporter periplasmic adaptor subunit n=1 Tax=Bosea sp. (in: a-proteobacteria) TaxID=1871050 RepID=UPI003B3BBD5A